MNASVSLSSLIEAAAAELAPERRELFAAFAESYLHGIESHHTGGESMLATLVKTLEAKDLYTRGHTERVAQFAVQLAQELKLSGDMQERIRHSALIHDLGKLAVPRDLLKKSGRLTTKESKAMRCCGRPFVIKFCSSP